MIIKSVAHCAYNCADMEKSLHLYCDILGLKKVFDIKKEGKPWIEYLKICDGQFIELFYTDENAAPFKKDNLSYSHLCLEVYDIFSACDAVKNAGYPIDVEPTQGADMNWQAWLTDPDGNRIELMQISPESPQAKA